MRVKFYEPIFGIILLVLLFLIGVYNAFAQTPPAHPVPVMPMPGQMSGPPMSSMETMQLSDEGQVAIDGLRREVAEMNHKIQIIEASERKTMGLTPDWHLDLQNGVMTRFAQRPNAVPQTPPQPVTVKK